MKTGFKECDQTFRVVSLLVRLNRTGTVLVRIRGKKLGAPIPLFS
jgi:hypothetical protein